MGRKYKFISVDRVLSKLYRDLGLEEISETDVVEWVGEALEAIGTTNMYEEAVAFLEIKDHRAELPNWLHAIIQVAKNNEWSPNNKQCACPANVLLDCNQSEMLNIEEEDCPCRGTNRDAVTLDCHGNIIEDYELAYYRPYFDLRYEYDLWRSSHYYRNYTPIRLANHTFFNSIVCPEESSIYSPSCVDEYTIQDNEIRTSFKEGFIAISYYKQKIDENTGYPLIPDNYSVITAITMYITMKYMARMWYMGRESYNDKYQKAEQDWHWYCKQASTNSIMPHGLDEHQNLLESRHQLIPKHNRYYGFLGKLGRKDEMDKFRVTENKQYYGR